MKELDEILSNQLKKENVFISKELDQLLSSNKQNQFNSSFWFNAVFNEFEVSFEYISYKKSKNRETIKGLCSCESAYKILDNENTKDIFLMFKDKVVKKISAENISDISVKYKSENSYIIKYKIKKGDKNGI